MNTERYQIVQEVVEEIKAIISGPARSDLFIATQYVYDKSVDFKVTFTTKDGDKIVFCPISIQHEDGSGNSFNIEGYINQVPLNWHGQPPMLSRICRIYFNTHARVGRICYKTLKEKRVPVNDTPPAYDGLTTW